MNCASLLKTLKADAVYLRLFVLPWVVDRARSICQTIFVSACVTGSNRYYPAITAMQRKTFSFSPGRKLRRSFETLFFSKIHNKVTHLGDTLTVNVNGGCGVGGGRKNAGIKGC
jgi:hypothetical protein